MLFAYYGFGYFKILMKMFNSSKLNEQVGRYSFVDLLNKNPDKIPPIFTEHAGIDNPVLNESNPLRSLLQSIS